MAKTIVLRYVTLVYDQDQAFDARIRTVFPDGREWGAYPHPANRHYTVISHRCGYGDDLWAYAWEHEFCHAFVCERLFGEPSYVMRCLVDGVTPDRGRVTSEELVVQAFQRFLRAGERPIVGGVDWDGMKAEALALLA